MLKKVNQMLVKDLIEMRKLADPEAVVRIYDGDLEKMAPVGAMIYGNHEVELLPEGYD